MLQQQLQENEAEKQLLSFEQQIFQIILSQTKVLTSH